MRGIEPWVALTAQTNYHSLYILSSTNPLPNAITNKSMSSEYVRVFIVYSGDSALGCVHRPKESATSDAPPLSLRFTRLGECMASKSDFTHSVVSVSLVHPLVNDDYFRWDAKLLVLRPMPGVKVGLHSFGQGVHSRSYTLDIVSIIAVFNYMHSASFVARMALRIIFTFVQRVWLRYYLDMHCFWQNRGSQKICKGVY